VKKLVDRHLGQYAEALFLTKIRDWESEQEYRFVEFAEDDAFSFVDYGDGLAAVVLGHDFPGWQRSAAVAVAQEAAVPVFQLEWELGRPRANPITNPEQAD
jgi:hypothetical protein